MEDKINVKRSERDLSPSAYSQSSTGLEWDPSADVGTSANMQEDAPPGNRITRSEIEYQKKKCEHHSDSERSSSTGTSTNIQDDASIRPNITRSEIEYRKKRNNVKSDTEGSSAGTYMPKPGDLLRCSSTEMTRSEIEYRQKRIKDKSNSDGSLASALTNIHRDGDASSTMTRSEIEYKKKRTKDKSDSEGSSVIWVEVQQTIEQRNPSESRNRLLKDIGIQTSIIPEHTSEPFENTSVYSSLYHSTPTDRFRSLLRCREKNKAARSDGEREEVLKTQDSGRRRERSPPQPFAAASRRSSHRCHDSHHIREQQLVPHSQLSEVNQQTSSSSELSPSCFLIDQLGKTGQSAVKNKDLLTLSAIEMHRDYHVKKVRHELKQLDKLNQLLSKNLKKPHDPYPSGSKKDDFRSKEKVNEKEGYRKKSLSPKKSVMKASPVVPNHLTEYSSTTNTSTKDSSSHETYATSGTSLSNKIDSSSPCSGILKVKKQDRIQDPQDQLEMKMDKIIDTFAIIAEMLFDNKENVPVPVHREARSKAKKVKKAKKELQPVKPPEAYFINFDSKTSNGHYVIEREDRDSPQKNFKEIQTAVSSDQEPDEDEPVVTNGKETDEEVSDSGDEEGQISTTKVKGDFKSTLQDAFQLRHPSFINRVQGREAILTRIKCERELRAEKKREWVRKYGENPAGTFDGFENSIPAKGPRLMTTKQMRELTEKMYKKLPEVRQKILQRKAEEEKRTNRLMSQVFASKLQQGVLKGELNILHSQSLIRR